MRLSMVFTRTVISGMLLAAAACETGSVNTEPEKTGGSSTAQAPKKEAQVGDTVPLTDDAAGVSLAVTLTKVVDPAKPGEFESVANGKRLVAVRFKVKNNSDNEYQDSPSNGARAIDTTGQAYDAGLTTAANCQDFAGGEVRLTKGESQIGCVTFEVDKNATVERIRYGASSGLGSAAEWRIV